MSVYETQTTTTTYSTEPVQDSSCNEDYIRSRFGITKIVAMVLCLIVFACTLGWCFPGCGFVAYFTALSAFITTLIVFFMHVSGFLSRQPSWGVRLLIPEFIWSAVESGLFTISFIIAAVYAGHHPAVGAACFFCALAAIVFGFDAFQHFRHWKTSEANTAVVQRTTHQTTTEYNVVPNKQQY